MKDRTYFHAQMHTFSANTIGEALMSRKSRLRQRQRAAAQTSSAPQEEEIEVVEEEIPSDETEVEIVEEEPTDGAGGEDHEGGEPEPEDEDPYEVLRRNLEAALKDKEEAEKRWEAAETKRQEEARRRAELEARDVERSHTELANQKAILEHALMAAEGEATNAEAALASALSEGDYATAAKAQRAIAAAEGRLQRLREGHDALEERIKSAPPPEQPRIDPSDPVEQQISTYTPRTQTWLRTHKTDIFNSRGRMQMAIAGDAIAQEQGIRPDTDEYFAFLDKHMGYQSAPSTQEARQAETPPKPRAAVRPSAPVSRSAAGSRNVVTLTADERDTAHRLGMTPAKYAEYKKRISDGEFNVRFG